MRAVKPSNSYRSDCSRYQARNSSSDISFSAAVGIRLSHLKAGSRAIGPERGDALDTGRGRLGDLALFERDGREPGKGRQSFAGLDQRREPQNPAGTSLFITR
jgi:hypothetical protein